MCAVSNGWTEKLKELECTIATQTQKIGQLERKIAQQEDEIRILKLRLQTARKILDDIASMADRIN